MIDCDAGRQVLEGHWPEQQAGMVPKGVPGIDVGRAHSEFVCVDAIVELDSLGAVGRDYEAVLASLAAWQRALVVTCDRNYARELARILA